MSFLAPLFLLGGLAILLPIVFHLIRRTTRQRTVFSSIMFLRETPPRLTRRSRLEHLLLLALRCAALVLLAFGFARPFLPSPAPAEVPGQPRQVLILVDTSASMKRGGLWEEAQSRAGDVARRASAADEVAVFGFDRQVRPLMTFEQWRRAPVGNRASIAAQALKGAAPGWGSTSLAEALTSAADTLADSDTGGRRRGEIVLISDLQEGSRISGLQGYHWPQGVRLVVEYLKPRRTSNASLQLAAPDDDADPRDSAAVRVRISNAADSRREQFQVSWGAPGGEAVLGVPVNVAVPPGQSRTISVPSLETSSNAPSRPIRDRLVLRGDEEPFDNEVFVVQPPQATATVLYVGVESDQDPRQPLYFLKRAFRDTRRQAIRLLAIEPEAVRSSGEIENAALVIVGDGLPADGAERLRRHVELGHTVIFALRDASAAAALGRLLGQPNLAAEEARVVSYAMLAEVDFRHALFAAFAEPRYSDFTKLRFWKYRKLDPASIPGARTVAGFDSGDPAVLDIPLGKGRVIVFASGWHPADSQLALSTKFVPMLFSGLEEAIGIPPAAKPYVVGDPIPVPAASGSGAATVRTPDGTAVELGSAQTNFSGTTVPGIYLVSSSAGEQRLAVNLDPAEGRTPPMAPEELERLGAPLQAPDAPPAAAAAASARYRNSEAEARQKLWRWFVLAALGAVILESWLAGLTFRRAIQGNTVMS